MSRGLAPNQEAAGHWSGGFDFVIFVALFFALLGQDVELVRHCGIDDVGGQARVAAAIEAVG